MTDAHHARAEAFLEREILIDGHNDLPWVIRTDKAARGDVAAYGLDRVREPGDTDIPRLRRGRVGAQVLAAFLPSEIANPATVTLEQIDIIHQIEALHPDAFHPVRCADDIVQARKAGKIASITSVEGTVGCDGSLAPLRMWYALGMRLVTLCHNGSLPWIDSATDAPRAGGLSAFGRDMIRELNDLGVMIDLAHVAHHAMAPVLDTTRAPLLWSHSNAYALCSHPRNVPEDILDRVPANGGVVMATFVPSFISQARRDWERPFENATGAKKFPGGDREAAFLAWEKTAGTKPDATLAQVCDHIDYLSQRVGHDHVGIGSDFFNGPRVSGLEDVSCFPALIAELMRRGWNDENLAKLAGGNFLRVFRAVEATARN